MSASLQITISIINDKRVLEAVVTPGGDIPVEIFLYANTGQGLGDFFAVCSYSDFSRFRVDPGVPTPTFGNGYLRSSVGRQSLELDADYQSVIKSWTDSASKFRAEYLTNAVPSVQTVNI